MKPGQILNLKKWEHISADGNARFSFGTGRRKEHLCVMILGWEPDGKDSLEPSLVLGQLGWRVKP